VEFEVAFKELSGLRKTSIAHQLLEWKMKKEKWNPDVVFASEACVRFNIPGKRISDIIPFELNPTEK